LEIIFISFSDITNGFKMVSETREISVKLTLEDIETIIEELERVEHHLYKMKRLDKIIKKLKDGNKRDEVKSGKV